MTYTFQVSTGTSWSQVTGRAIDGKHRGAQLEKLEAIETTWEQWRQAHPDTKLLKKSEEVLWASFVPNGWRNACRARPLFSVRPSGLTRSR